MEVYQRSAVQMAADPREKVILDLRKEADHRLGACPGSVCLWWETMEKTLCDEGIKALGLPEDRPIYLLCYTGETSDEYAQLFRAGGYEAYSIAGGYRGYLRHQLGLDGGGA